jgi:alkanesulfonate monooxygenase SsuD/methylene tetrahydromethanopterin reductase-like flavin-dependent oxidoreductase (luciferase family)
VCILPEDPWPVAAEKWRHAEAWGFDHAWTYDHLAWRDLRDGPWHAAMPTLTAAAAVTSTIRLGTLVASPNFRHPVTLARDIVTVDDVSGGRFTLGIGAGGEGWDATILGQEPWAPRERADRFEEFVTQLDALLCDRELTVDGRFWSAVEARAYPGCVQQPRVPFAVAATGPRGMRLAARFADTWVTTGSATTTSNSTATAARSSSPVRCAPSTRRARPKGATRRPCTGSSSPTSNSAPASTPSPKPALPTKPSA